GEQARRNRDSRCAQAVPGSEPGRARDATSDSTCDRRETSRAQDRQSCECLPRRRKEPPNETDPCLRRTTGECTREQIRESRTRPCNRRRKPACECCCRSQTPPHRHASTPASLQHAAPSTPSTSRRTRPHRLHATPRLRRVKLPLARIHLTDRARSFDP